MYAKVFKFYFCLANFPGAGILTNCDLLLLSCCIKAFLSQNDGGTHGVLRCPVRSWGRSDVQSSVDFGCTCLVVPKRLTFLRAKSLDQVRARR